MKRIIKFRAWDTNENRMWSHKEIDQSDTDGIVLWGEFFRGKQNGFSPLMQFTGLNDRNGREIYEGDILCFVPVTSRKFKNPYDPWVVEWDSERRAWPQWGPRGKNRPEVIGNIYENPDLLEPK